MRRLIKPAVWTAIFLACAGVGAYLAATTDPFPPGVDRPTGGPTGRGSPSPSPSPEPVDQRWTGVMRTVSAHELFVGGACRSRWRTELQLFIRPDGRAEGSGVATPVGDAACDFQVAQEQADEVRMTLGGRLDLAGVLFLTFENPTPVPAGSTDLGGFLAFLEIPRLACESPDGETAELDFHGQRSDGNRGTYEFDASVRLRCRSACGPIDGG